MGSDSTKDKILNCAYQLFIERGFDSVSVREIATLADVNVASVNYHFSSKEGLFQAVLTYCYNKHQEVTEEILKKGPVSNLEDFSVELYRTFCREDLNMAKSFKTFVLDATQIPEEVTESCCNFGPPSGRLLSELIVKELGAGIEESELRWASKTIFSHIAHMSIINNSAMGKAMKEKVPEYWNDVYNEDGIRRLVRIVMKDLRDN